MRMVVLLPAPLAPRKPKTSPWGTLERDIVDGHEGPEAPRQVLDVDGDRAGARARRCPGGRALGAARGAGSGSARRPQRPSTRARRASLSRVRQHARAVEFGLQHRQLRVEDVDASWRRRRRSDRRPPAGSPGAAVTPRPAGASAAWALRSSMSCFGRRRGSAYRSRRAARSSARDWQRASVRSAALRPPVEEQPRDVDRDVPRLLPLVLAREDARVGVGPVHA